MITRSELTGNRELLENKVLGGLAGVAIGDSFGDAGRKPENNLDYGMMADFSKGKSWSTDDTEFALFTAKMLIDHKGDPSSEDFEEGWKRYILTQDEFPRGGASEREAANNLKKGLHAPHTGLYSAYAMSDGAAMRIPPVGILCAGDIERAAALAKTDAEVSHSHEGVWAAQAVAAAVAAAMVDATDEEIIGIALRYVPEGTWLRHNFELMLKILEDGGYDFFKCWMPLHDELRCEYKAAVAETVVQAFGVFLLAKGDFRYGMFLGGNFGRDADTLTAIVGALLGARGGAASIPEGWIDKTGHPTGTCLHFTKDLTIRGVAQQLSDLIR
ncbi:ADP-ribosylglycohydrolase [Anaerotaenia torta]|uniref:ADP-ribosylglycohydrolase family protein n=1 Tax=Anaerotaenia torta TaxID=433293 RepID=UPI003D25247B